MGKGGDGVGDCGGKVGPPPLSPMAEVRVAGQFSLYLLWVDLRQRER